MSEKIHSHGFPWATMGINPKISGNKPSRIFILDVLLLLAISAAVIFPALGQNRNWSSREIRHAEIIREMAESGDYLVPKLLGETYYDKPPIMHAAAAVLTRVAGGPGMTIVRTPSAIAGILGILAAYGLGLLLFDRRTALLGALVLTGTAGYTLMARQARPDMVLCLLILLSSLCLGLGMRNQKYSTRALYFVLAGVCAGGGIVTKGPYGILFPVFFLLFAPFRRKDLSRPRWGWISIVIGIVVALSLWAVPAYLRDGGEYLHRVVFQPDLDVMNNEGQRWDYFYYFLPGVLYTMPVILFLPLAIVDLRRRGYSAPLAIAGAIFVVISFVHQKRTHYLLPLYPFLALGIASCLVHYREKMPIVKKGMWIVIPLSIAVTPVYFSIIQPILHPAADLDMVISRETLRVIEPDAIVYCVKSDEALAWVGKQHKRVHKVPHDVPFCEPFPGIGKAAYILTDDKNLKILFNTTGQPPYETVLQCSDGHEKRMLLRLKTP